MKGMKKKRNCVCLRWSALTHRWLKMDVTKTMEETSKLCNVAGNKINKENSVLCLYTNDKLFEKKKNNPCSNI